MLQTRYSINILKAVVSCVLAFGLSQSTQADSFTGQRWAVLIGVDDYVQATDLNYCGADMVALQKQLVSVGFPEKQIKLIHDNAQENRFKPFKANIEQQLKLVLQGARSDDLVIVAFSGHGVHLDGTSYFCPAEARLSDPATLISLNHVYDRIRSSAASLKLVVVDACRNDPRVPGQKSLSNPAKEFASALRQPPPEGMILLSSCAPQETSYEDPDFGHGVFMHHLLEGLQGKADSDQDKAVSVNELGDYASRQTTVYVADRFNDSQRPWMRGDLTLEALNFGFPCPGTIPTQPRMTRPVVPNRPVEANSHPKTITNSIGMQLTLIPAGEFMMGSPASEEGRKKDETQHLVQITKPFYAGIHEVTVGQALQWLNSGTPIERDWIYGNSYHYSVRREGDRFVRSGDTRVGQSDSQPMVSISWHGAVAFCEWCSERESGYRYRLPTEAEWEYMARAGSRTSYPWGSTLAEKTANVDDRDDGATMDVGSYEPNAWGLFDTVGNALEWCSDRYAGNYYAESPMNDPVGPEVGSKRVVRGGCWYFNRGSARSSRRISYPPWITMHHTGFRVVCEPL